MYRLGDHAILFLPPETVEAAALEQIRRDPLPDRTPHFDERRTEQPAHPADSGAADLAYLDEGTQLFDDYIRDVHWAQAFARLNRDEYRPSNVLLDEIPSAYKDIDAVMEHTKSLVEIRHTLKQFLNVKGD